MRRNEILIGLGLAVWSVFVIGRFDINHLKLYTQLNQTWLGFFCTYMGLVAGPALAASSLVRWSLGRRSFSLLALTVWCGLAIAISNIVHGFTPGSLACVLLAGSVSQTALGLRDYG